MRDTRRYKCASQCNGAESACENDLTTTRKEAEQAILGAVANEILTDKNIDKILKSAIQRAASQNQQLGKSQDDQRKLASRIASIEKQMGNLAEAIAKSGFTDALQRKYGELEQEHKELSDRLAVLASGGTNVRKLELDMRTGLNQLRQHVEQLATVAYSKHATQAHRDRLRTALKDFLGEVPVAADYTAGCLVATVEPTGQALTLLATGPGKSAYRSGSGGRLATLSSVDHGAGYSLKRATLEDGQRAAERALTTFGAACAHPHSPMTFQVALPGMELPTRYVHVLGAPRNIQSLVLTGQLGGVS